VHGVLYDGQVVLVHQWTQVGRAVPMEGAGVKI
jgi:hypothetical protein